MSIEYSDGHCILLSHRSKINQVYDETLRSGTAVHNPSYEIHPALFEITSKYLRSNQSDEKVQSRKRDKINRKKKQIQVELHPDLHELTERITSKHGQFTEKCRSLGLLEAVPSEFTSNVAALSLASQVQDESSAVKHHVLSGQNPSEHSLITEIGSIPTLIPPDCSFFQDNVANMSKLINDRFHFVSIDPPWWNKYIRRTKLAHTEAGYKMLDSDDIAAIPLEHCVDVSSLVAIWCTNSPSHIALIRDRLLAKWNLRLLSVWYWVKITTSGQTVCDFGVPLQKQPYEQLFVACHRDADATRFVGLEESRYLFSVPSAIHSHKPPIIDLFREFLPARPKCLEVFARYLMPGFTSIGLEVLKLQNLKLFREMK